MAIGRWLDVRARVDAASDKLRIFRSGELATLSCNPDDDLIWRGIVAGSSALRRAPPKGVRLDASSDIPVARGLGSSAAALIAGVLLANEIFQGGLDSEAIIDIAASLEGHPDNVAPSALGGAVLSVRTGGHHYASVPITVHDALRFVFLVPDFEIRTAAARAALPADVAFETAVTAASRAAALVMGLQTGNERLLTAALDDVLHVPVRRSLVRGYDEATNAAVAAGAIGATLSGSGSTIVAVATVRTASDVCEAGVRAWRVAGVMADGFVCAAESRGAQVELEITAGNAREQ